MGEISEMMIDGTVCQICGEYMGEGEGYPVTCAGCADEDAPRNGMSGMTVYKMETNTEYLQRAGAFFTSFNNGLHLVVTSPQGLIDYWPSTNKFSVRKTGERGRGYKRVLQLCGLKAEK